MGNLVFCAILGTMFNCIQKCWSLIHLIFLFHNFTVTVMFSILVTNLYCVHTFHILLCILFVFQIYICFEIMTWLALNSCMTNMLVPYYLFFVLVIELVFICVWLTLVNSHFYVQIYWTTYTTGSGKSKQFLKYRSLQIPLFHSSRLNNPTRQTLLLQQIPMES